MTHRQPAESAQALLAAADGVPLHGDDYRNHFNYRFPKTGPSGFWKLERRQHFLEPTDPSWCAFTYGDWNAALELLEERRHALTDHYAKINDAGFETHRIRIVDHILTGYMQWELHLLHLRDQLGGHTRIINSADIANLELDGQLPEVITLGAETMYEITYDERGLQEGGVFYADAGLAGNYQTFIRDLYERGEPIASYFDREVAPLPPPAER